MAITDTTSRLASLRSLMKARAIDMYIVPSEDAHQSEFVAACDARRAFLSGFTGSAGTAVVTPDKAILATDGRYFAQAEKQLGPDWELLKQGMADVPYWRDWVSDNAAGGKTVAIDPAVITATEARKLSEKIVKSGGEPLKSVAENLVDLVWTEKPSRPNKKITVLDVKYAGKKFEDKLDHLRKELEKKKSEGIVLSMLDEIAWLFNLRGSDIDYNPVFFSYAIITPRDATLYVDESKLTPEVTAHLASAVTVKPYAAIFTDMPALQAHLQSVNAQAKGPHRRYTISSKSSWALSVGLGGVENAEEMRSPVGDAKAIKNETEMAGMRACHVRDGAALIEYFAWLEDQLAKGAKINEIEAADKLEHIRSKHDLFVGLSFDTISSAGPNAAIIHYTPQRDACAQITTDAIYLCDSGAQYLDGTTDTTRTLHFGAPTAAEREAFTLVLKGNIALERAVFPKRTTGLALDALARQFLWARGRDYSHGTGHGVGSFLNVHEGPVGIGTRREYADVALSVGNVLSNEPGYYEDGAFGIRIENMMMVVEAKTEHGGGDLPFYGFEHVTMVPMCRKLIDVALLDEGEKKFLNDFHAEVFEKTKGFFGGNDLVMDWLKRETAPY